MVFCDCLNENLLKKQVPVTKGHTRVRDLLIWKWIIFIFHFSLCCESSFKWSRGHLPNFLPHVLIPLCKAESVNQKKTKTYVVKYLGALYFWPFSIFIWCNTINHPLRTDSSSNGVFKNWRGPEADNCVIYFLSCEVGVLFSSFLFSASSVSSSSSDFLNPISPNLVSAGDIFPLLSV